jgi:hypothetical protein
MELINTKNDFFFVIVMWIPMTFSFLFQTQDVHANKMKFFIKLIIFKPKGPK